MAFKNGHYIDSGLPLEERERLDLLAHEENQKLKSWDDVPLASEDQNDND